MLCWGEPAQHSTENTDTKQQHYTGQDTHTAGGLEQNLTKFLVSTGCWWSTGPCPYSCSCPTATVGVNSRSLAAVAYTGVAAAASAIMTKKDIPSSKLMIMVSEDNDTVIMLLYLWNHAYIKIFHLYILQSYTFLPVNCTSWQQPECS